MLTSKYRISYREGRTPAIKLNTYANTHKAFGQTLIGDTLSNEDILRGNMFNAVIRSLVGVVGDDVDYVRNILLCVKVNHHAKAIQNPSV